MFNKVLVANRGAIARRILRTLHRLDIGSVAVFAESDAQSLHVHEAQETFSLGDGGAAATYLDADKLIELALRSGADAIHPGYGFLSENAEFVDAVERANLVFIGPSADHIRQFGLKHRARALAEQAGVPLLAGSELLANVAQACQEAERIGYPVMLKSTAGGGGIGMQACADEAALCRAFDTVRQLGASQFADDGVFLERCIERARHIEVQVFGDGKGQALAIGERDCSTQRRHQKVLEECPAPHLSQTQRDALCGTAENLLARAGYSNAGTVEFIVDADTGDYRFLEVNTRLQVEHGVTEAVYGIDLVEWMLSQASGATLDLAQERRQLAPSGHAIQVRVYAEDPYRNFRPGAGLLSDVRLPDDGAARIDHWLTPGLEVSSYFDPLLAKVIVHECTREQALLRLRSTLDDCQLYGTETSLRWLRKLCDHPPLVAGRMTTESLAEYAPSVARIDVLQGGTLTTIQDSPGRTGYWHVGVPPSGPFDHYSFRLANRLLGNAAADAGIEITLQGPELQFSSDTHIALGGAAIDATLDGLPVPTWQRIRVLAGQVLHLGRIRDRGSRAYLCVAGGIQCPPYLGSRATFTLGLFGGHNGRALRTGDVLSLVEAPEHRQSDAADASDDPQPGTLPDELRPHIGNDWTLLVLHGPHGTPEFFTEEDIDAFYAARWKVHYNSSRTGIRLVGPKPDWARADGGEAGLHPSNIHDNAYAFGSVDFTGDMPVILGPDGPSLGGFVCPATVIQSELWKLGQLRAGDTVRFEATDHDTAVALEAAQTESIRTLGTDVQRQAGRLPGARSGHERDSGPPGQQSQHSASQASASHTARPSPVLNWRQGNSPSDDVVYRAAGDHFLLVEYGQRELDIRLRLRAHALMQWLEVHRLPGMRELTPGIRSLQIHFDSQRLSRGRLLAHLEQAETELATQLKTLSVPSRVVYLPLSWNDTACQEAIDHYQKTVRRNAPWYPSNLEFIRRINGLDDMDAVKRIVFDAAYLVLGLGDVYLGAPVATPIDPRHRLVTTKYNPARTWTAENSVGIGGAYLCVYGMEGPGGYQFVGRTLQMWNRYRQTAEFSEPWLLRFFDQIRFFPVEPAELLDIRRDFPHGRYPLRIEHTEFSLAEHDRFTVEHRESIERFRANRHRAFEAELKRWHADGQFHYAEEETQSAPAEVLWPTGSTVIESPVSGSVWTLHAEVGRTVEAGETLVVLESMKMEIPVSATRTGRLTHVLARPGQHLEAGQPLLVLEPST